MAIHRHNDRRGVLLLIILALLAMFGVTAIGFYMIASSGKRGAQSSLRAVKDADRPERLLNEAALQVLVGSDRDTSAIGPHSLLEDVYGTETLSGRLLDTSGNETFEGRVSIWQDLTDTNAVLATKPSLIARGQIVEFTVRATEEVVRRLPGRVLTFTSGDFAGISTRILTFRQAVLPDGTLMTWPTTDPDGNYQGKPVWRIQVVAEGLFPLGRDGRPGVPDYDDDNDDGDNDGTTNADTPGEYAWPTPNPPYGNSDDLKPGLHGSGTTFVINGAAFCGTGFGFRTATTTPPYLNTEVTRQGENLRIALLPKDTDLRNATIGTIGGANEDYDAIDYQNMLLGSDAALVDTNGDGVADTNIPSLHRQALVNYWFNWMANNLTELASLSAEEKWKAMLQPYGADYKPGGTGANADPVPAAAAQKIIALKRLFMMRPLPEDHPDFDGSNPASRLLPAPADYATRNWERLGPWDVDNDGDGVPDSIWVDIGLPARPALDGRMYKPLVAILCTDLDGRLNLNAHGSVAQTDRLHILDNTKPSYYQAVNATGSYMFGGEVTTATLLRGQGAGPAEINLGVLFGAVPFSAAVSSEYQRLLFGTTGLDGRYGESDLLAASKLPGPGRTNANDPLSLNKLLGYPSDYTTSVPTTGSTGVALTDLRAYGAPPDLKSSLTAGVDLTGQPIYAMNVDPTVPTAASAFAYATTNHPYELDLSRKSGHRLGGTAGAVDNPYGVSELETLLRPFDADYSTLPTRLVDLAPSLRNARRIVTTDSWDLPCPSVALTHELRTNGDTTALNATHLNYRAHHVIDLLYARGVTLAHIAELMPLDLQAGLRMDLNRPFGNGRDDSIPAGAGGTPAAWPANGVVDEPEEAVRATQVQNGESLSVRKIVNGVEQVLSTVSRLVDVDVDKSGGANPVDATDQGLVRQLYARHLYVLAMLLTEANNSVTPYWTDAPSRARFLAQWAVNVVDFRDRDSIMTRFEYDSDPFDNSGDWNPDEEVWGVERPELLITETVAFHNRATEDRADEQFAKDGSETATSAGTTQETDDTKRDLDFDQRVKPQGSLFIELYNPAGTADPLSGEFCYNRATSTFEVGVRLNQTTPSGHAVWRLIIAQPEEETKANPTDPTYPKDPDSSDPPATIERSIRFVDPGAAAPLADDGNVRHYPSGSSTLAPIKPGRYALIGTGEPAPDADPGDPMKVTYLGLRTGKTEGDNQTRRIELTPNQDPDQNWVGVFDNRSSGKDDLALMSSNIQRPVAVVVNRVRKADGTAESRRLSITEPDDGYPDYLANQTQYNPIRDKPLDKDGTMWSDLSTNARHPRFRVVYLQRLANPLADYNATTNPYRTVDSMPVDLTTFNGVTADPAGGDDAGGGGGTDALLTRERGDKDTQGTNYLWTQERLEGEPQSSPPSPASPSNHYYANPFAHTLGYLNRAYCYVNSATPGYANPRSTTGYVGSPPGKPFPWLTWANRPFLSPQELLLVPTRRSSQVFKGFEAMAAGDNGYTTVDESFAHLLNFLYSQDAGTVLAPQLHRLFEFVQVPSRFESTEIQGDPFNFASTSGHMFHPPCNAIPSYREPGRINLNTVFSDDVFRGLLNLPDLSNGGLWNDFILSRRGYGAGALIGDLDNDYPTQFVRPFRSYAGRDYVPLTAIRTQVGDEINSTIFRVHPNVAGQPLFQYQPTATATDYNDMTRNPFFRYQLLERLGNSVTNRSNVYAVWITLGYFEVERYGGPPVYPDGYRLKQELGFDTGEVKRHRAFYIIDRSIPVGFQRGQTNNAGNCMLLKRFIE
jgi:hypothetical protein